MPLRCKCDKELELLISHLQSWMITSCLLISKGHLNLLQIMPINLGFYFFLCKICWQRSVFTSSNPHDPYIFMRLFMLEVQYIGNSTWGTWIGISTILRNKLIGISMCCYIFMWFYVLNGCWDYYVERLIYAGICHV